MKFKLSIAIGTISIILFSQCNADKWTDCIKGNGEVVSETRTYDRSIKGVEMDISGNLYIKPGEENDIRIDAQQNIIDNIETYLTANNYLRIKFDKCVRNYSSINIIATIPKAEYLAILGSGSIYAYDTVFIDHLEMAIEGSGDIHMLVMPDTTLTDYPSLATDILGSGNVELRGFVDRHTIDIDGSGDIHAYGMETNETYISVLGSGNCKVYVNDLLDVYIDGSGDVYYRGHPSEKHVRIEGSGNVYNDN